MIVALLYLSLALTVSEKNTLIVSSEKHSLHF
jgi:hypothetical protein